MRKIKILWVVNELFPEVCERLNLGKTYVGGWVNGLSENIKKNKNIDLHIATAAFVSDVKNFYINEINFHVLPTNGNNKTYQTDLENHWKNVVPEINPDVIHIHGTEYAHGLALMNALPDENYVISIQGLVSVCVRYYLADLTFKEIFKNISLRDIIRFDTIWQGRNNFRKRGKLEKLYLKQTKNVIGRTDWDYSHVKKINPEVKYHFCNETLRPSFYKEDKWKFGHIEKHTIFLSQSSYPLKGLHKMLEALAIVKNYYPDVQLNIAGENILARNRFKTTGYGNIIKEKIKKLDLAKNINFKGILNEEQMKMRYLKSHIFICPSSIENSPNSLGEAQILGVPSIASYVGGTHNFINHGVDGFLYRFEEVEILASLILNIFQNRDLSEKLSQGAIVAAEHRHNAQTNAQRNIDIYKSITLQ